MPGFGSSRKDTSLEKASGTTQEFIDLQGNYVKNLYSLYIYLVTITGIKEYVVIIS